MEIPQITSPPYTISEDKSLASPSKSSKSSKKSSSSSHSSSSHSRHSEKEEEIPLANVEVPSVIASSQFSLEFLARLRYEIDEINTVISDDKPIAAAILEHPIPTRDEVPQAQPYPEPSIPIMSSIQAPEVPIREALGSKGSKKSSSSSSSSHSSKSSKKDIEFTDIFSA